MNCRAKTLSRIVMLACVLGMLIIHPDAAFSQTYTADVPFISVNDSETEAEIGWKKLNSDKIQIQAASSNQGEILSTYPPTVRWLMASLFEWQPIKYDTSDSSIKSSKLKNQSDRRIERHPKTSIQEMMENLAIHFDVSDTRHFRKVWFHFKKDLKVRGLFAIHDFEKSRPFVVLRMGIHGNVDEILAERYLFKIAYEELDANVLILESLTSHAFLSQNQKVSFGGIDEGLQTFLIIEDLAKPNGPMQSLIKSVHLLGLSMGGHGTFVTALIDQNNRRRIKSILNMCPLINLEKTFSYHAQTNVRNAFMDLWNARRLKSMFDKYEADLNKSQWWMTLFDMQPRFTPTIMASLNREHSKPLLSVEDIEKQMPTIKWPKGFDQHLQKSKSFYELNDFWPYFQGVKTPIIIFTTPNDPLVINEVNSDLISSGKQPGDFSHVKSELYKRGIHCGLSPVYQWDYVVESIKNGLGL